jgi:hypothetical protein
VGLVVAQHLGVGAEAAVGGDLVVLDLLRGHDEGRVLHGRIGVLLEDLLALFDQAGHAVALFPLRGVAKQLEDLLQTPDLALGLGPMLLECCLEVGIGRCFRHLGECFQDLTFGVVDVLQFVDEEVVQRGKLGHTLLLPIGRPSWRRLGCACFEDGG